MTAHPPDPVAAYVAAAAPATPAAVLAAMHAALRPRESGPAQPPPWLHAHHHPLLHRVLHGLQHRRLALLAAPTGHGKSHLALAAAVHLAGPAVLVVPAALRPQWTQLVRAHDVPHIVVTHERLSRTTVPLPEPGLVIVDEAHRFRSPATQRYRRLAPLLVDRRVLLLTATPIVNRLDDLLALLQLAAPDDVLRRDGVPSLQRLLVAGQLHPALAHLVHSPPGTARPPVRRHQHRPALDPGRAGLLAALDAVVFSRDPAVATLLRGGALRALASSVAALDAVLARCERLHRHAAEAAAAGHPLSRAAVLRATQQLDDQLLLWGVLPADDRPADLEPGDLPRIAALRAACATARATDLAPVLACIPPDLPTVIFTSWRATAAALVRALGSRAAWVTGRASGIGPSRLPREAVLAHFRTATADPRAPRLLVATDVAAEGLDLRRLRCVIHADLPWTPTRLRQREGRARRAGLTASVLVHLILPPPALEAALRQLGILRRKAAAARALRDAVRLPPWELAWPVGGPDGLPPPAAASPAGTPLACRIAVRPRAGGEARAPCALCLFVDECGDAAPVLVHPDGPSTADSPTLRRALARLAAVARRVPSPAPSPAPALSPAPTPVSQRGGAIPRALAAAVAEELRRRLALRQRADWALEPATVESRLLATRLRTAARSAVQRRDAAALARLDRALRWCTRSPAAGDRLLQQALLAAPALEPALEAADRAGRFRPSLRPSAPALRLVAVCAFVPSRRAATFAACPCPARSSSTSTARSSTASGSSSTATTMSPASTA